MTYVDGFVLCVPKKNFNKYKKMASDAGKVWKKFGAVEYFECVGEDMHPKGDGTKFRPFPELAKPKAGEQVWFSFVIYKSKKHRDEVNKKVMNYFHKKYGNKHMEMPFDMKRFSYGGFKAVVKY